MSSYINQMKACAVKASEMADRATRLAEQLAISPVEAIVKVRGYREAAEAQARATEAWGFVVKADV